MTETTPADNIHPSIRKYRQESTTLKKEIDLRIRMEDALRESNEILQNILSLSPVAIGLIENNRFVWVNDTMCEMFGYEIDEYFKEAHFSSIFPSKVLYSKIMTKISEALPSEEELETDHSFKRNDGSVFEGNLKIRQ